MRNNNKPSLKSRTANLFLLILVGSIVLTISSCDDGNSNNTGCTTEDELLESECKASALADFCGQFACTAPSEMMGDIVSDTFFFLPPCDQDCVMTDCTTLMCGVNVFSGITITENEIGGADLSIDGLTTCDMIESICE